MGARRKIAGLVTLGAGLGVALGSAGGGYAASTAPAWGAAHTVVLPSGANAVNPPVAPDPRVDVTSLSCWSAGNCAAVGTYVVSGASSNVQVALLLMEHDHVWQPSVEGIDPGVGQFELPAVACVSPGTCVAVGSYRTAAGDIRPDVFSATMGAWTQTGGALQLPGDRTPGIDGGGTQQVGKLESVSCASAGNCVAVGHYYSFQSGSSGPTQTSGMIVTEAGGTWAAGVPVVPPTTPPSTTSQDTEPTNVACDTAGRCDAAGSYSKQGASGNGLVGMSLSGTGGSLATNATALPIPADADTSSGPGLYDIPSVILSLSCGAGGNCATVENYFETGTSGSSGGLLSKSGSGAWTEVTGLTAPAPYNVTRSMSVVSCDGSAACGAVGTGRGSGSLAATVGWDETGGAWNVNGQVIELPAGPSSGSWLGMRPQQLSCAAPGNCTTVGLLNATGRAQYNGFAASEIDGTWQQAINLDLSFGDPTFATSGLGPDPLFGGVDCPSTGDCTAAGYYYDKNGNQLGFVIDATGSAGTTTATTPTTTTTTPTITTTTTTTTTTPAAHSVAHVGAPHPSGLSAVLPVSCSGGGSCPVTLTLSATETLNGSKLLAVSAAAKQHRKVVVLGVARATIASGKSANVKISLNAAGRRLLTKHATLPVTLTVKMGGKVIASDRLKFKRRPRHQ